MKLYPFNSGEFSVVPETSEERTITSLVYLFLGNWHSKQEDPLSSTPALVALEGLRTIVIHKASQEKKAAACPSDPDKSQSSSGSKTHQEISPETRSR